MPANLRQTAWKFRHFAAGDSAGRQAGKDGGDLPVGEAQMALDQGGENGAEIGSDRKIALLIVAIDGRAR